MSQTFIAAPIAAVERVMAAMGNTNPHHPGCSGGPPARLIRRNSTAAKAAHHRPKPTPMAAMTTPAVAPLKPLTSASVAACSRRSVDRPTTPAGASGIHSDGAMAAGSGVRRARRAISRGNSARKSTVPTPRKAKPTIASSGAMLGFATINGASARGTSMFMTGGMSQPPLTPSRPGVSRRIVADHASPNTTANTAPTTSSTASIHSASEVGSSSGPMRPQPTASTSTPAGTVASIGPWPGSASSWPRAARSPRRRTYLGSRATANREAASSTMPATVVSQAHCQAVASAAKVNAKAPVPITAPNQAGCR